MATKSGPPLFLGIELSIDQLRASLIDENLHQVGSECVDFDSELPEYQTQGGIFTTPGDAYTTPVEMWVKGLDLLLGKLHRNHNHELTRIRSIGGSAQHALVWWKSTPLPSLSTLSPAVPLSTHFPAQSFSMPSTPTLQDSSSHSHALMIQNLLGGPEAMAARVGTAATPGLAAGQMLRIRESWGQEVWARTGRVQVASSFLGSLISGRWMPMAEAEACATGMWVHGGGVNGYWDEGVMEIVGGSSQEGRRLRGWMGDVDTSGGSRRAGAISRYLVDRYGFDPETIVTPFTSDSLCSYLSLCPSPNDAVFSFGPMDLMLTPVQNYVPNPMYNIYPHPVQEPGERKKYIAVLTNRNADVARALVRDMYTKSWSAFDRLVAIVPPGGSIGLDDKLFSFWRLQADSHPYSHLKGIFRFETGVKVNEFRDLRANPRCLLESQVMTFRVKWSQMLNTGLIITPPYPGSRSATSSKTHSPSASPMPTSPGPTSVHHIKSNINTLALGLPFDPYDPTPLPKRLLCTGAAANFPSIVNLLGDVFGASVYVPNSQIEVAQVAPFRNSMTARAAIGSAWVARWTWMRERGGLATGLTFEDDIRRCLMRNWKNSGMHHNKASLMGLNGLGLSGGGSNTPVERTYASGPARSGLGNSVLVEDDESEFVDEVGDMAVGMGRLAAISGLPSGAVLSGSALTPTATSRSGTSTPSGYLGGAGNTSSSNTPTYSGYSSPLRSLNSASTLESSISSLSIGGSTAISTSTSYTSVDTNPSSPSGAASAAAAAAASGTTTLVPISALPTGDKEAQMGWSKVAEPDVDAFMCYASIVPEYCRLEATLIRSTA